MSELGVETYPVYDGLEDIISETRAWYSALGLQMGGSLYSVIRASEGITGLVRAIAKTLGMHNISKKVRIAVEDIPSIAYVTPDSRQTIVHVGSWLYSREKMEQWHPQVKKLSENELLVLSLGLINGAVALDMIAKSTEHERELTLKWTLRKISGYYSPENMFPDAVRAVEGDPDNAVEFKGMDERFTYISAAIHDILSVKACLTMYRDASWALFPLLLFRELFDKEFAIQAREQIKKDDTLDNLVWCVSALRCFSKESAEILDVSTSVGINIIRAMLASVTDSIKNDSEMACEVISSDLLDAYAREIAMPKKQEEEKQDSQSGEKKSDPDDGNNENQGTSRHPSGMVDGIAPEDSSAPVNNDVMKQEQRRDEQESFDYANKSSNKRIRVSDSKKNEWLEDFMRLAFSGKVDYNRAAGKIPAPVTFNSVSEYVDKVLEISESYRYANENNEYSMRVFEGNVLKVYDSVDKVSLKNLFMARTMDVEKSQPARSGISLIPTRIVNMFTDEKIFSPLPENETERESEVIILVDASGSMRGNSTKFIVNGRQDSAPLYDGVVGAARAIAEGLQKAHVNCSVYAHSTMPGNFDQVFVCKITDQYSMDKKNEFINAGRLYSRNNGDSYALEEVSQSFSQDGRDIGRTLIVLSDGQPACDAYSSMTQGRRETRDMANKLRDEGIQVYSISLTRDVVPANNSIYGEKYNFFPADESEGAVSLSPMLKKIVDIVSKDSVRGADNVLTQG